MGAVATAFTAAFDVVGAPDKAAAAALGGTIETYIGAQTVFDLANMPTLADLSGKAGYVLVVNVTEDGFTLEAP